MRHWVIQILSRFLGSRIYQTNTRHLSKEGQRRHQDEREQIGREAAHVYQPFSRFPVIAASPKWFTTSFFGNL